MNITQKLVLIAGLVLLLSVLIFLTPYNHIAYRGNTGEMVLGTSYSSIFLPPYAKEGRSFIREPYGLINPD